MSTEWTVSAEQNYDISRKDIEVIPDGDNEARTFVTYLGDKKITVKTPNTEFLFQAESSAVNVEALPYANLVPECDVPKPIPEPIRGEEDINFEVLDPELNTGLPLSLLAELLETEQHYGVILTEHFNVHDPSSTATARVYLRYPTDCNDPCSGYSTVYTDVTVHPSADSAVGYPWYVPVGTVGQIIGGTTSGCSTADSEGGSVVPPTFSPDTPLIITDLRVPPLRGTLADSAEEEEGATAVTVNLDNAWQNITSVTAHPVTGASNSGSGTGVMLNWDPLQDQWFFFRPGAALCHVMATPDSGDAARGFSIEETDLQDRYHRLFAGTLAMSAQPTETVLAVIQDIDVTSDNLGRIFWKIPTTVTLPAIPFNEGITHPIWTNGDLVVGNGYMASCAVNRNLIPSVIVNGARLYPNYSSVNGYVWFQGNNWLLYYGKYSNRDVQEYYTWILIASGVSPGYVPETYTYQDELQNTCYGGDHFYVGGIPLATSSPSSGFTGLGSAFGEASISVQTVWDRADCVSCPDTGFGSYTQGDNTVVLGVPYWTSGSSVWIRSLEPVDEHFTYNGSITKTLSYDGADDGTHVYTGITYNEDNAIWCLGTYQSEHGWFQSATEPSTSGTTTFTFQVPAKENKIISWGDLIRGISTDVLVEHITPNQSRRYCIDGVSKHTTWWESPVAPMYQDVTFSFTTSNTTNGGNSPQTPDLTVNMHSWLQHRKRVVINDIDYGPIAPLESADIAGEFAWLIGDPESADGYWVYTGDYMAEEITFTYTHSAYPNIVLSFNRLDNGPTKQKVLEAQFPIWE